MMIAALVFSCKTKQPLTSTRALETVDVGTAANDGTGDPLRTAFQKVNAAIEVMNDVSLDQATGATGTGNLVYSASPTLTGTVVLPSATSIGDVSSTEIGYVDNVTSSIQTQLNSKVNVIDTSSMLAPYILDSEVQNDINDTITARLSGGTVGVALADSNKYDGGYATPAWVEANAGGGNADSAKIVTQTMQFITGVTPGAPQDGDSIIASSYFEDKNLKLYVNGERKYYNTTTTNTVEGFRFVTDTGIIVKPALATNDQVIVEINETNYWQTVYINSLYDGLLAYWSCNSSSGTTLNDSHISRANMTTTGSTGSVGKLGTYAVEFDGNTQYAYTSSSDVQMTTDEMSISMWIYLDQKASTAGHTFNLLRQGGSPRYSLYMSSSDRMDFRIYSVAGTDYQGTQGAKTDWSTSTWYHIVAVAEEGEELKIYVNGVLDKWWSTTYDEGMCDAPAGNTILGGLSSASSAIDGRIDDVALYDRPLTSDEVSDLYNSGSGTPLY